MSTSAWPWSRATTEILEAISDGVVIADRDGRIAFANTAARRLHGSGLVGIPVQGYPEAVGAVSMDGRPYDPRRFPLVRACRGETVEDVLWRLRRPDEQEVVVQGSGRPLRAPDGAEVGGLLVIRHVSDRERMRDRLEGERARLHALFRDAPARMAVTRGPAHVFEMANTRYVQSAGGRQIEGMTFVEVFPELTAHVLREARDEVYRTGRSRTLREVLVDVPTEAGDTDERFYDIVYQPVYDREGRVDGVMSHAVDVTWGVRARRRLEEQAVTLEHQAMELRNQARRLEDTQRSLEAANEQLQRANEDLARAAERLRFQMDAMPQKVWTATAEGEVDFYNQRWLEYTRLTYEELLEGGWREVIHPDDREPSRAIWADALRTGREFELERRFRDPHSEYRWHLSRGHPQRDPEGRVRMWVGTDTDIHEQKRAQRRLKRSSERLRGLAAAARTERRRMERIFVASPAVMAICGGPDHVITLVNPMFERVARQSEAVGRPLREVFPQLEGTGVYEMLDRVYRTGKPVTQPEVTVRLPRGRGGRLVESVWHIVWLPLPEHEGQLEAEVLVHAVDITAQVHARREVERARRAAEQANEAKSTFLATMSHELRTPLNGILGYAQLLELGMPGPVNEKQIWHLGRIRSSSRHLLGMINDVLDLAKVESGKLSVARTPVPVRSPVGDALAVVGHHADDRRVRIDDQTERASGLTVLADENRVRQILVNLINNAVKFTEEEGRVRIAARPVSRLPRGVEASGPGPWVSLTVEDTGVGIPADKLEHIFEPFTQAEGEPGRRRAGTGLGLAISRELARLMAGDLTAHSVEGEGSTFTLWLPAGPTEGGRPPVAPPERKRAVRRRSSAS